MIRHIVLVRFPADLANATISDVLAGVHALKQSVPGILAVHSGVNNSPESLARGYTHGFTVDFADAAARDGYLPHPEHVKAAQKLVSAAEGGVDGVLVLDFAMD